MPNGERFTNASHHNQTFEISGEWVDVFWEKEGAVNTLDAKAIATFCITPIRKIKVKPIEFTVEGIFDCGHQIGCCLSTGKIPDSWAGKTFREVLPEEKDLTD